jgi:hypothetical protein
VREWLLFNSKRAFFQLYHGKNKLHFNEMMVSANHLKLIHKVMDHKRQGQIQFWTCMFFLFASYAYLNEKWKFCGFFIFIIIIFLLLLYFPLTSWNLWSASLGIYCRLILAGYGCICVLLTYSFCFVMNIFTILVFTIKLQDDRFFVSPTLPEKSVIVCERSTPCHINVYTTYKYTSPHW